jgi:uncharacterized cupin superfamily protein
MSEQYKHIVKRQQAVDAEGTFSHPWNPNSEISGAQLSRMGGLKRTGVSIGRLKPGRESFAYHLHHNEEEWVYILSGCGVAHIDGEDYALEPGDFVGFPAPSKAHQMINRGSEDLVYLMGGENLECEVADFPALDRRMVRTGDKIKVYKLSAGQDFGPL